MKPALAQKLYSQARVLVENPTAEPDQSLWPMARAEFLLLVTTLTGRESLQEALDVLLKISQGEITQNIPEDLKELVRELERAEEKQEEARLEAMRRVRQFLVAYSLQKEGVTTQVPRFTREESVEREPAAARRPLTTSLAPPTKSASPQPPTPLQHSQNIGQALEKVVFVITKPSLPIPAQLVHFATSLPARVIKTTLDLGREALAQADPNVQTFALLWREGITARAIKEALRTGSVGISQDVGETLKAQADVLESYEKSHPTLTNLLTFYHQTQNLVLGMKAPTTLEKSEEKNALEIVLNTSQKTIVRYEPFLRPTQLLRGISAIFNNPLTRFATSPLRRISANLISGARIAAIRAPVEVGRIFSPGGPVTPPTIPTFPTLPTSPALSWTPGRGLGATLGRGGIGMGRLLSAGLGAAGGLLGAAGGILGGIGAVGGAIGGVAAAGVGVAASGTGVIVLIIGGAILLPIILTLINIQGYQGAFLGVGAGGEQSLYIAATKITPETSFKNEDLPKIIPFRITVSGKKGPLKNVRITDSFAVSGKGSAQLPSSFWQVGEITNPWTQLLTVPFPDTLEDNLVINTLAVVAEVEGQPEQRKTTTMTLSIGTPPQDCPSSWPTAHGYINQGPNGTVSHRGIEAVDIHGNPRGTEVRATHGGLAYPLSGTGKAVEIVGTCNGKSFSSYYSHLLSIAVSDGQEIKRGDVLGTVDCTGDCLSDHVHYQFGWPNEFQLKMGPPFIPAEIPESCVGKESCGNIEW